MEKEEYIKPCKLCGESHSIVKGDYNLCETCAFLKQLMAVAKQRVVYFRTKLANAENKVAKLQIDLDERRAKRKDKDD